MKKCPFCAEEIEDEAVVCGRDLPGTRTVQVSKRQISVADIVATLGTVLAAAALLLGPGRDQADTFRLIMFGTGHTFCEDSARVLQRRCAMESFGYTLERLIEHLPLVAGIGVGLASLLALYCWTARRKVPRFIWNAAGIIVLVYPLLVATIEGLYTDRYLGGPVDTPYIGPLAYASAICLLGMIVLTVAARRVWLLAAAICAFLPLGGLLLTTEAPLQEWGVTCLAGAGAIIYLSGTAKQIGFDKCIHYARRKDRSKMESSSGARTLATISIICGGLGLIVLPIPLGLVAVACGIPALAMNAKGGGLGIVVGIIDIVIGIVMIAAFAVL